MIPDSFHVFLKRLCDIVLFFFAVACFAGIVRNPHQIEAVSKNRIRLSLLGTGLSNYDVHDSPLHERILFRFAPSITFPWPTEKLVSSFPVLGLTCLIIVNQRCYIVQS